MLPITIPISTLRAAFPPLNKVIAKRTTLPILSYLKFARFRNCVAITATDLDRTLTFMHPLEPAPLTPLGRTMAELRWKRDAGEILVPRAALQAALKAARAGEITISERELHYEIAGADVCVPFETLPVTDFPETSVVAGSQWARFDAAHRVWLVEALRFVSSDETRYVLNGVLCQSTSPAGFVATDGRRLYRRDAPALVSTGADVILPTAAVQVLGTQALLDHDWDFGVAPSQEHALIDAGPWRLITKLIEGNFPNYRQVIPDLTYFASAKLTVDTHQQLCEILTKLPPSEPGRPSVVLRFHADRLGIHCESPSVSLTVLGICSDAPVLAAFDRNFLLGALSIGPGTFRLLDEMEPMVYEAGTAMHVLMPRRSESGIGSIQDAALDAASARWMGKRVTFLESDGPELAEGEVTGIRRSGLRLFATVETGGGPKSAVPIGCLTEIPPKEETAAIRAKSVLRARKATLKAA